jgi:tRNA threonylcarbamoyladenosine biosynthesis protein TsaB
VLTLALDTTTRAGSVAVMDGDRLLAVIHGDPSRTHGERLPGEIDRAMEAAGVTPRDLGLLAVATGPGAFTGLRIGLAAMQGLAMVIGRPVVGVSALDALAAAVFEGADPDVEAVAPWLDAQRGEVFGAFYRRGAQAEGMREPTAGPTVGAPEVVLATVPPDLAAGTVFVGDGARTVHRAPRTTSRRARPRRPPACVAAAVRPPL